MSLVRLCSGVINGTGVVDSGSANSLDSSTVTELSSSDQTSATDDNFFALGVFVGVCLVVLFFLIFLAMLLLQADHFYF
ncbi:hypothetical protein LEP1GSC067_1159 [Leptospira interrogans serovar Lora str. TE 1992]|uniref:Uncharacterized protein n=1 Tax=Leptospira interrogans serovar Lora str. TE 1992 TaxID=1193028 RepID=M3F2K3_LEPIR|nr:hypothetical protein LEP1GSC067_1159 [Leptospira interrogans serovar Lora str. TE 1992]